MTSKINIKDRTSEVEEMLGTPPGWLSRSGSGIFLLIIIAVLSLLSFIEYPEIIEGRVKIEVFEQDSIVATIRIPIEESGYIKVGQEVEIKLNNFPYWEFGKLEGKISYISKELTRTNLATYGSENVEYYLAEITMCNSLITNLGKDISGHFSEMIGMGQITIKKVNFFELIINNNKL